MQSRESCKERLDKLFESEIKIEFEFLLDVMTNYLRAKKIQIELLLHVRGACVAWQSTHKYDAAPENL